VQAGNFGHGGISQGGHAHNGLTQGGYGQPAAGQASPGQPNLGQPSPGQPSPGQPSPGQHGAGQHGLSQHGAGQFGGLPPQGQPAPMPPQGMPPQGPQPGQPQGMPPQGMPPQGMAAPGMATQPHGHQQHPQQGQPQPASQQQGLGQPALPPQGLHRQPGAIAGQSHNGMAPPDAGRPIAPQRQLPPGNGLQYPPDRGGQFGGQAPPAPYGLPPGGYGSSPYSGPQSIPVPQQPPPVAISVGEAVQSAHAEGFGFGEAVARDAPALWLEAVLARKPRMPSDLEARLLQGSALPIDSLLHDEVRHALRRGFWDALERSRH
jgi:hypothetical protein